MHSHVCVHGKRCYSASIPALKGVLTGTLEQGVYDVVDVITVPEGKELTLQGGTTLRFQNFTGISVEGELLCKGTVESPVVLTSWNDGAGSEKPEPFDWNGIKVDINAISLTLENAILKYSTFGLNIESERTQVQIRKVTFCNNGYSNLARGGQIVLAADGMPVNYFWPEPMGRGERYASNDEEDDTKIPADNKKLWKKIKFPIQIGVAALAIAGGIIWSAGAINYTRYDDLYMEARDESLLLKYKERRNDAKFMKYAGAGVTSLGCAGFVVTFFF